MVETADRRAGAPAIECRVSCRQHGARGVRQRVGDSLGFVEESNVGLAVHDVANTRGIVGEIKIGFVDRREGHHGSRQTDVDPSGDDMPRFFVREYCRSRTRPAWPPNRTREWS